MRPACSPLLLCFLLAALENCNAAYGDPEVLKKIEARPSKCGPLCQRHGTCNEELGRCDCPRNLGGKFCELELTEPEQKARCSSLGFGFRLPASEGLLPECLAGFDKCINKCNERGTCNYGFCHCNPGHYGIDCSLSLDDEGRPQVLQGTGYVTRVKRPWIYIYDIPWDMSILRKITRVDRPTFFYFLQRLLGSGAVTADASKADYFFVPLFMRHPEDISPRLVHVMGYIKRTWPYYSQRLKGSHVVMHTGDWGKRELPSWYRGSRHGLPEVLENLTWLTHWGIYNNTNKRHWEVAHQPGQDIVIPVITPAGRLPVFGHDKSPLHPLVKNPPEKNKIFFLAGRICGEQRPPNMTLPWPRNCKDATRYSGGVRQRVHSYHHHRPGYMISKHIPDYGLQLRTSKYCLSTQGGGHGNRQVIATLAGCLPVSIGDGIYEPFEPMMDYSTFGLKVKEADIPTLHEIIDAVGEQEYARKQVALKCAAQHLHYASMVGGMMHESGKYDGFETILEILRVRADHPTTPIEEYSKVDAEFKRFMACGAEEFGDSKVPPLHTKPSTLCSISTIDTENKCHLCLRQHGNTLGPPGGAICCGHLDLSSCPRVWD